MQELEFAIPLFKILSKVVQGIFIFSENFFKLPYLDIINSFILDSNSCIYNAYLSLYL